MGTSYLVVSLLVRSDSLLQKRAITDRKGVQIWIFGDNWQSHPLAAWLSVMLVVASDVPLGSS